MKNVIKKITFPPNPPEIHVRIHDFWSGHIEFYAFTYETFLNVKIN